MLCPNCYKDAPIVYRGVSAHCTACGALRVPLANQSVNMAGQPSKVGGAVAKVFGWLLLGGGTAVSAALIAFFQWLFEGGVVGWAIGVPIFVVTADKPLLVSQAMRGQGDSGVPGDPARERTWNTDLPGDVDVRVLARRIVPAADRSKATVKVRIALDRMISHAAHEILDDATRPFFEPEGEAHSSAREGTESAVHAVIEPKNPKRGLHGTTRAETESRKVTRPVTEVIS